MELFANQRPLVDELIHLISVNQKVLVDAIYHIHFNKRWVERWEIKITNQEETFLKGKFVAPLLKLLISALKTRNESILYIYLDERLRYAPHQKEWSHRVAFHKELVRLDFQAIVKFIEESSLDVTSLNHLWQDIHAPLIMENPANRKINLLGVGDCLLNEVRVFLPTRARKLGMDLDMRCAYFSASQTGGLDTGEILTLIKSTNLDLISFSFFSFEGLPLYAQLMRSCDRLSLAELDSKIDQMINTVNSFLIDLRKLTQVPFLLHTVSGLPLRRWRKYLPLLPSLSRKQRYIKDKLSLRILDTCESLENCLLVDEEAVVAKNGGLRQCSREVISQRDFKGLFHTSQFGDYLSDIYILYALAYANLHKTKVICVDFDNTLWRGVMADGEVTHWHERQSLMRKLKNAGMLLVALSKNTEDNIRWEEMTLQPEDFVLRKINWNPKAQSIKEATKLLNLGIDSFIVVDDSKQERALINQEIPDILCLDAEAADSWIQLECLLEFPNTQQTEEAKARTTMYQEQAERKKAMIETVDYPAMMASLQLWYRFSLANKNNLDRIAELVARTNQFNTTTIRYSKTQLNEMLQDPDIQIYAGELGDRFGTLGLTVVVILRKDSYQDRPTTLIDSFVMSCRAMGFSFEDQILHDLVKLTSSEAGTEFMLGRYQSTSRNTPCAKLYHRNGFTEIGETDFILDLKNNTLPQPVGWFTRR